MPQYCPLPARTTLKQLDHAHKANAGLSEKPPATAVDQDAEEIVVQAPLT